MSKRRRAAGFTLIELIIAVSLSAVILLSIFAVMTSMVQTEVNGMRDGTVTVWSLANIGAMNNDIPVGSYLAYPLGAGVGQDGLVICTNWSPNALGPGVAGPLVGGAGSSNVVYEYCYDSTAGSVYTDTLLRKIVNNSPPACPGAPSPCTAGGFPATNGNDGIIATGVYRSDYVSAASPGVQKIFTADAYLTNGDGKPDAVDIKLSVGRPNAGVSAGSNGETYTTLPQTIPFNMKILLED